MKRRHFILHGALVVTFSSHTSYSQQGSAGALPGSLKTQPLLNGWIRIDADGGITVFSGKAELGQGIKTALAQLAAEELVVDIGRIQLVTADTERTPNEGYTAGSHSMQDSGTAIRNAAAQVRSLLSAAAAQRLGVPAEQLVFENGTIRAGDKTVRYGQLVSEAQFDVTASPHSSLRDPKSYKQIGKPVRRVDIPAKVTGGIAYVQDFRLPGMLHGRVVRPEMAGASLVDFDDTAVRSLPGVVKVVRDGSFIGVVAQREFQAIKAARVLATAGRWNSVSPQPPARTSWTEALRSANAQDLVILDQGAVIAQDTAAGIEASFERPYQMHASIGPSCAVAQVVDGKYTVWTHSQGVYPLRQALAELLGVAPDTVHCIHLEGSGCYGHNGADDVAADAALLARAAPGTPVRVQWMRGDEHVWEPYGPPMSTRIRATLDAAGAIDSWQFEVWSATHSTRPGGAGDLLAGTLLARPFAPTPPKPIPQPEGGGDRNAIALYRIPNTRVTHHFLPDMPLRVSALRSLGAYMNVFSIESFMDELARKARVDPVAFRLRHLDDARAQSVIQSAADTFGWSSYQRRATRGRGIAFARYKNLAAYAAVVCEVEVWRDTGEVRLLRMVAAVDSGEAVNPDGIRNQIEGGIVQSASWTLLEEVKFDGGKVASRDWGGYPILRFPQAPARIDVVVLDRPGEPFLGTGEAAQGPAAAAIANAFSDATGVRLRNIPFSRSKVRSALSA